MDVIFSAATSKRHEPIRKLVGHASGTDSRDEAMAKLVFVDCEAAGPCPGICVLTEFGAVDYETRRTFHGVLHDCEPDPANPALSVLTGRAYDPAEVFAGFKRRGSTA